MKISHFFISLLTAVFMIGCSHVSSEVSENDFIRTEGQDLIAPDGSKFFIKGTNLGNWLNPEGYMFRIQQD